MSRVPESDSGETTIEDIAPEDLTAYLTGDKRGILGSTQTPVRTG